MTERRAAPSVRVLAIILVALASGSAWASQAARGLDVNAADVATRFPAPDAGYVTDRGNLLTKDAEERIEQWLWDVEERTGVEIAVVTIDSILDHPDGGRTIEAFARGLFDEWGIGNLPANDGVLLLVAVRDRKARIELGAGHGLRRDADAAAIMDGVIVPRFRRDAYEQGIVDGVKALMREFAGVRIGFNWPLLIGVLLIPILIAIAVSLFRSGKRGWGWVVVGVLVVIVLGVLTALYHGLRAGARGSSSGWSSGGFGGGFGGGFSGGGGATGSW